MKRALVALIFCASLAAALAYGRQNEVPPKSRILIWDGFMKARNYLSLSERQNYAMGLVDGFLMAPAFGAPDDKNSTVGRLGRCIRGMDSSQVAAIIEKYVRDHPGKWDWDAKNLGQYAMLDACRDR